MKESEESEPQPDPEPEPKLRSEREPLEVGIDDNGGEASWSRSWKSWGGAFGAGGGDGCGAFRCNERTASETALAAATGLTSARFCGKNEGPGENGWNPNGRVVAYVVGMLLFSRRE